MYLKHMRPYQLQEATAADRPLLVPAGCIETHGPHMAIGHDTIIKTYQPCTTASQACQYFINHKQQTLIIAEPPNCFQIAARWDHNCTTLNCLDDHCRNISRHLLRHPVR